MLFSQGTKNPRAPIIESQNIYLLSVFTGDVAYEDGIFFCLWLHKNVK